VSVRVGTGEDVDLGGDVEVNEGDKMVEEGISDGVSVGPTAGSRIEQLERIKISTVKK
jgi:hypothetical protein